jgi:hypothetical protein
MKVSAGKQYKTVSLPTPATKLIDQGTNKLKESFSGWLEAVAPKSAFGPVRRRLSILTNADFMRVSSATVREGESHCIWPPDVLERFQLAEVITNTSVTHYVVNDSNINRVL